mgnify:CR=1 FL=1
MIVILMGIQSSGDGGVDIGDGGVDIGTGMPLSSVIKALITYSPGDGRTCI